MITVTQLEYIAAVEKAGSFRRAAKACHVTQPTLSMQIQKLEDYFGVLIFDRAQQHIQSTPIGRKIVEQARIALSEIHRITAIIHTAKDSIEGKVRLGVIPTLAPYVLPLFLNNFCTRHPKVNLEIEETKTEAIVIALQRDRLDIGLLATPLLESSIKEHPLFIEPFYVYASHESPLSSEVAISEEHLKKEQILLLTEGHCLREQMVRICRYRHSKRQIQTNFEFASGSIETLCRLVEKGHGYTIVPHLARSCIVPRLGKIIPFSAPYPSREVSLVTHQSFAHDALVRALIASIKDSLPSELTRSNPSLLKPIPFR